MNFILRKVLNDNTYTNSVLGNQYQVIERETNYDEFSKAFKNNFDKFHVADLDPTSDNFTQNCYAFLVIEGGSKLIPLYKKQWNYIMTESGKTFENLTYK